MLHTVYCTASYLSMLYSMYMESTFPTTQQDFTLITTGDKQLNKLIISYKKETNDKPKNPKKTNAKIKF